MAQALEQLEYAPPRPWHRRPWVRRWAIVAGFLCAAGAGVLVAPMAWEQVQVLLDQRQCLGYTALSNAAVYEADADTFGTIPEVWPRFYSLASGAGLTSRATVFLHERTDPDGISWLVAADLVTADVHESGMLAVHFRQFQPGSLFTRPKEQILSSREPLLIGKADRVFAGQIDPVDESHFWFEYEATGQRKRFDCWLTGDGIKAFESAP